MVSQVRKELKFALSPVSQASIELIGGLRTPFSSSINRFFILIIASIKIFLSKTGAPAGAEISVKPDLLIKIFSCLLFHSNIDVLHVYKSYLSNMSIIYESALE